MAWFAVTVFCMSAVMEVSTLQPGQTPNVLTGCLNVPVDLVFLVDTSGSVGTSGFEQMLGFIQSVSANLNLGMGAAQDRVAVAYFSDKSRKVIDFTQGISLVQIKQKLRDSTYDGGSTQLPQGLSFVGQSIITKARPQHEAKIILAVLSDGSSDEAEKLPEVAASIRRNGVDIIAVSIKNGDDDQLRNVVGTDGLVLKVAEFQELSAMVAKCTTTATTSITTSTTTTSITTSITTSTTTTSITTSSTTSSTTHKYHHNHNNDKHHKHHHHNHHHNHHHHNHHNHHNHNDQLYSSTSL